MNRFSHLLYLFTILVLSALLTGCGMTDVWKQWEQPEMKGVSPLKPSEVKAMLCSQPAWEMMQGDYRFFSGSGQMGL